MNEERMKEIREPTPCLRCGFSHRFQYPDYSDASKHEADVTACINTLLGELDALKKERDKLKAGLQLFAARNIKAVRIIQQQGANMHPSTEALMPFFKYDHLPEHLQTISKPCGDLAQEMADRLEGAELTAGLRKLLEAKDCFVRAALPDK